MSNETDAAPEAPIDGQAEELPDQAPPVATAMPARALALAPRPPAEREVLLNL